MLSKTYMYHSLFKRGKRELFQFLLEVMRVSDLASKSLILLGLSHDAVAAWAS